MFRCLYVSKLCFHEKNYKFLKKKFKLIKINNISRVPINIKKKIDIIFLPMDNFYNENELKDFKQLKIIASPTTGDIHIDKKYLLKKKIKFINLKNKDNVMKNITATSDLVFAFIFELTRRIMFSCSKFISGQYNLKKKLISLSSINYLSIGIIGLGRIGKHVANRCKALGMKVYYYDPNVNIKKFKQEKSLKNLFKKSNIVSLHVHYNEKYYNLINIKLFKIQKKPSFFINTSRGGFLNEVDLIKSIKSKILSGAALDVLKKQFNFSENKESKILKFLFKNKDFNLIITPKIGGTTKEARYKTENHLIRKVYNFLNE